MAAMTRTPAATSFDVLVDSDAFVGRFFLKDPHHQRALSLFDHLQRDNCPLATTNLVLGEAATVLSHRDGQVLARQFLDLIAASQIPVIHVDEQLERAGHAIFRSQTKRGTSWVDCANVAVLRQFHIARIFSFDQVYTRDFHLQRVTD